MAFYSSHASDSDGINTYHVRQNGNQLQLSRAHGTLVFLVLATTQYRRIYAHAKLQAGNSIYPRPNITVST